MVRSGLAVGVAGAGGATFGAGVAVAAGATGVMDRLGFGVAAGAGGVAGELLLATGVAVRVGSNCSVGFLGGSA